MREPWNGWADAQGLVEPTDPWNGSIPVTVYPRAEGDPEYGSRWLWENEVVEVVTPVVNGWVMVRWVDSVAGLHLRAPGVMLLSPVSDLRPLPEKKHEEWCELMYGGSVCGEPIPDYACICERRKGERRKGVRRAADRYFPDRGRRQRERRGGGE